MGLVENQYSDLSVGGGKMKLNTQQFENVNNNLNLLLRPICDGPNNGFSGIIITFPDIANVTGVFQAGETVTQTTSGATGKLVGAKIVGIELNLYIVTLSGTFAAGVGENITGGTSSADTVDDPLSLSLDNSPNGVTTIFPLLTVASHLDLIAPTLHVYRNGVLEHRAGEGDGTTNDIINGLAGYYYFHTSGGNVGSIEFGVAPAVGEIINACYQGYLFPE